MRLQVALEFKIIFVVWFRLCKVYITDKSDLEPQKFQ